MSATHKKEVLLAALRGGFVALAIALLLLILQYPIQQAFQSAITLKVDILVRFVCLISAYAIFTNLSAGISTELLAENGLLLQIALLSQFTIQGIGMTNQTLIGNFKGKGEFTQLMPLMLIAIANSVPIALIFAGSAIFFPESLFSLLTNHSDINQGVTQYTIWLLPLLSFTAIAFMLEVYFIGLKQEYMLRNASLITFWLVFLPTAIIAWYGQNISCLWLSLTLYMLTLIVYLGWQMLQTQSNLVQINLST